MSECVLDCKGLQCPEPVARCRAMLDKKPRSALVIVDNLAALENVSRFLKRNGYEVTADKTGDAEWRVKATNDGTLPEATAKLPPSETCPRDKTLILITTETLGRGDDSLGAKLMETFLGSLGELGGALWRIVLLNGGVKLAATETAACESLRKLEESGVDVLVCGTCLNHYGLLERKRVGETTNMMDIVTSLALASKVIRP